MTWRTCATMLCLLGAGLLAASCNGRSDVWDGDPDRELCGPDPRGCEGFIGASCRAGEDCDDGVCCLSNDCGGGTCTYLCAGDIDCPPTMRCHDGFCFYACSADSQCGPGQSCEHGETVCQY